MKFLSLADLQIHDYKQFNVDNSRLWNCLNVLDIVFKYAHKNEIDHILFPGDWFDSQKALPIIVINETVRRLQELFNDFPDIKIYAISGNHDYASQKILDEPVITSLTFLNLIFPENFILMDEEYIEFDDCHLWGLPYYHHAEDLYEMVGRIKPTKDKPTILMVHATVTGYENIAGTVDPSYKGFKKFDLVLSGDIHKKSWCTNNFLMLGCPIHRDAGDRGDDKGFWVIDTDHLPISGANLACKFVSLNKKFPVFITKNIGDKLDDWEKEQYVTWIPEFVPRDESEDNDQDNFRVDLGPEVLVRNFYGQVGDGDKKRLNTGLSIIKSL